jgi:hypothetical protein
VILALVGALAAVTPAQPQHPEVSREKLYFECKLEVKGKEHKVEVPINLLSPQLPGKPDQEVKLPVGFPSVHLVHYLPWAKLKQSLVEDRGPGAGPAVILDIRGPKLSFQRALVARDPARNQLTSLIGHWKYLSAADPKDRDRLFKEYENELTRDPRLIVGRLDKRAATQIPVEAGKTHELKELGCTIRIKEFHSTYTAGQKTPPAPSSKPMKRFNPAVRLEIEWDGNKEEWLVFSRFPEFNRTGSKKAPYTVRLDCPHEQRQRVPHFAVVTVGETRHEVWTRVDGKTASRPLGPTDRVGIPGSKYTFGIAAFSPAARVQEDYELTKEKRASTVLKIRTTDLEGEPTTVWLRYARPRTVVTKVGPIHLLFGKRVPKTQQPPMPHQHGGKRP